MQSEGCAAIVTWDADGHRTRRACKRSASADSPFCPQHRYWRRKGLPVEVIEAGGYCVWCAGPGRAYVRSGVRIVLCGACGKALARALSGGR
jgi:hypothetical protein